MGSRASGCCTCTAGAGQRVEHDLRSEDLPPTRERTDLPAHKAELFKNDADNTDGCPGCPAPALEKPRPAPTSLVLEERTPTPTSNIVPEELEDCQRLSPLASLAPAVPAEMGEMPAEGRTSTSNYPQRMSYMREIVSRVGTANSGISYMRDLSVGSEAVALHRIRQSQMSEVEEGSDAFSEQDCIEFVINIDKRKGESLGVGINLAKRPKALVIEQVHESGAIKAWNDAHEDLMVQTGDEIVRANEVTGFSKLLVKECKKEQTHCLTIRRHNRTSSKSTLGVTRAPGKLSIAETTPLAG